MFRGAFIGLCYWMGQFLSAQGFHKVDQTSQMQFQIVLIGAIGGALGAAMAPFLHRLVFNQDLMVTGQRDNMYGTIIIANVVTGLLLPRTALFLEASHLTP